MQASTVQMVGHVLLARLDSTVRAGALSHALRIQQVKNTAKRAQIACAFQVFPGFLDSFSHLFFDSMIADRLLWHLCNRI